MDFWQLLIVWIGIICWVIAYKDRVSKWILYPVSLVGVFGTFMFWIFNQ
ncbi:hypothetical protein ACMX2M_03890 [Paenibacillus polymyxa]